MCQSSISGDPAPPTYKFGPTHCLILIRITIIAIAVAAFVKFEAIQITWLRGFSLFVGSSKSSTSPFSSDTTVYRLPPQLLYLSLTSWSQRYRLSWATSKRYDRWEGRGFDLWLWPRAPEALFSGWIRRWDRDNAVARMQDLPDREASSKLRWSRSFRLLSSAFFFASLTI